MRTTTQHKLAALGFWEKHGINATLDFFKISRTTLYRWPKIYREQGSALHNQSRTSPQRSVEGISEGCPKTGIDCAAQMAGKHHTMNKATARQTH